MPVNTAALKTFAPAMRRQLLEAVGRKLDLLLTSQTPDTLSTYAKQIAELREQEAENREQLLERVAYTWFNRLCALRYLDARGWHPFGCKVLMPAGEGETQPELLKLMRAGSLPTELRDHTNQARLHGLLDGQIPPAVAGSDPQGEAYRELLMASCRFYHHLLPDLFEQLDDVTELLLPDDVLTEASITAKLRSAISDLDCQDVEALGWLYQFYISERKDAVMARKKAVPSGDIPAVTQLFTPHWIVRYLVENSLGRLWLLNRPNSKLRKQMPYYIEGEACGDFIKINRPEEIKVLDPACGSGHMLTYAFDLLFYIYEEDGYSAAEIPGLILRHNLHGLEICPRASQLAGLALILKAREKSRRFFQKDNIVRPKVIELRNITFEGNELNEYIHELSLNDLLDSSILQLLHQFNDCKTFGSLIQPCIPEHIISRVRCVISAKNVCDQILLLKTHLKVIRALDQAEALSKRYQIVIANPPYMGAKGMNSCLAAWAKETYPSSKYDLFAMFIERAFEMSCTGGYISMVTMQSWMFLSSYENFRRKVAIQKKLMCLAHLGAAAFPEIGGHAVQVAAFTFQNDRDYSHRPTFGKYDSGNSDSKNIRALNHESLYCKYSMSEFLDFPSASIAYWISDAISNTFKSPLTLEDVLSPRQGMATSDNQRFLRFFWEVGERHICRTALTHDDANATQAKWFPYNKGGAPVKWYGNQAYLVNWSNSGREILDYASTLYGSPTRTIKNIQFYFRKGITWSDITFKNANGEESFAARVSPGGFIFDVKGSSGFPEENDILPVLGFLNSKALKKYMSFLNPSSTFQVGDIRRIPYILNQAQKAVSSRITERLVQLAKADYMDSESSWGFTGSPLTRDSLRSSSLEGACKHLGEEWCKIVNEAQHLEEESNRIFIEAYGLQDELSADVSLDEITLSCNPSYRYGAEITHSELNVLQCRDTLKEFLSYGLGCMMGRYSLEHPGLILADSRTSQAEQLAAYEEKVGKPLGQVHFKPDADAIIPVLDGEWFEDDIVARTREFLEITFPESTVTENLRIIEESLAKDIRKYFCTEFYKDHLQTYKKRPIYWMVQSPKKGFSCLIYLHRYTKDTLNQVLNNYFRPYLQKLEARLAQLGLDQLNDDLPTRERTAARKEAEKITKVLKECQAWEQDALLPLAQQRIELDLDDGVKVNYLKLQDVLAPIPGLAAKED